MVDTSRRNELNIKWKGKTITFICIICMFKLLQESIAKIKLLKNNNLTGKGLKSGVICCLDVLACDLYNNIYLLLNTSGTD
jgi:hypothetical protein